MSDSVYFEIEVVKLLKKIIHRLDKLEDKMSAELDALQLQVEETKTVELSAITLIQGLATRVQTLADELVAMGVDATKVQALADELNASEEALASAVTTYTPPAPPA